MPYLNRKISGDASPAVTDRAARGLTALTTDHLGKRHGLTSVLVEFAPRTQWFIAGGAAEAGGFATFYLEVKITAGTNTKNDKARFLSEAHAALVALLGNAHPASNVVLHEVPADAWGYAGETQEARYVRGRTVRWTGGNRRPRRQSTDSKPRPGIVWEVHSLPIYQN